jgi:hypothetical protein
VAAVVAREVAEQEAVDDEAQQRRDAALHPAARGGVDDAGERPQQDVVGVVDELARAPVASLAPTLGGRRGIGRRVAGDAVARGARRAAEVVEREEREAGGHQQAQRDGEDPQRTFEHGSRVRRA